MKSHTYIHAVALSLLPAYLLIRGASAIKYASPFVESVSFVIHNYGMSTNDKMRYKYPQYFDYIQSIKKNTPENALIYQTNINIEYGLPLWPSNNIQMNSAWLYPRDVLPFSELPMQTDEDAARPAYLMRVAQFPANDMPAKRTIYFKNDGSLYVVEGDFVREAQPDNILGLIEL